MMRLDAHATGPALTLGRPNETIAQYKLALERAQARDDASAIGDYGYDMAVGSLPRINLRSCWSACKPLAAAADAAARGGRARRAADLYMRGGQSAAVRWPRATREQPPVATTRNVLSDDLTVHQAARSAIAARQPPR